MNGDSHITNSRIQEMLPAYVLGALEPEEMVAVDDYLNEQRALLRRLEELEDTTSRLAFTAPQAPLPADAKSRLMARVRADAWQDGGSQPTPPVAIAPTPLSRPQQRPREPQPAQSWFSGLNLGWVTAAGALALLLIVFWNFTRLNGQMAHLQSQLAQSQSQITELEDAADTLRAQNATLVQQLQDEEAALAVLTSTNRAIDIVGTDEAPGAGGTFFVGEGEGVLVLHGLEPLPEEQTYQLWFLGDAGPIPADLLGAGQLEPEWTTIPLPADGGEFAGVAVSIEPNDGSTTPTGPIVLATPLN